MKPPIASYVDLRDFAFMPLDVVRLWDSGLALTATGDGFRGAVLLWCKAWHQVPAGSLPNDEKSLQRLAGCDAEMWAAIRAEAMHGFMLCDDGRFYHPTVCEKAIEAWESREKYRKAARNRWKDKKKVNHATHLKRIEDASSDASKTYMQETVDSGKRKKEETPLDTPPQKTLATNPENLTGGQDAGRQKRGSRLSPDWQPDAADRTFAAQLGIDADRVADEFRDYWHAQPGQRGTKLDWSATWRNWCRRADKFVGKSPRPGGSAPASKGVGRAAAEWAAREERRRQEMAGAGTATGDCRGADETPDADGGAEPGRGPGLAGHGLRGTDVGVPVGHRSRGLPGNGRQVDVLPGVGGTAGGNGRMVVIEARDCGGPEDTTAATMGIGSASPDTGPADVGRTEAAHGSGKGVADVGQGVGSVDTFDPLLELPACCNRL